MTMATQLPWSVRTGHGNFLGAITCELSIELESVMLPQISGRALRGGAIGLGGGQAPCSATGRRTRKDEI